MSESARESLEHEAPERILRVVTADGDPKPGYRFMVSGDSISRGVVYDEEKSRYTILEDNYVSILQARLRGIVCNAARFGSTLIKGAGRLQSELSKEAPDVVLIEYGGNDCDFNWEEVAADPCGQHNPRTDLNIFQKMLKDTIDFLKNSRITPVLMTLPPLDADRYFQWISRNNPLAGTNILKWLGSITKIYWWQERYNAAILKIAEETRTLRIDVRGAFLQYPDFTKLICLDGIHPNREGHRVIAEKITGFVRTNYGFLLREEG